MGDQRADQSIPLRALMEGLHGSVLVTDRELRVLEVNASWERDLRISRERAIGRSFYDIMPAAEQWRGAYERCLAGEIIKADKLRIVNSKGRPIWLQSSNIPWRDATGRDAGSATAHAASSVSIGA